LNRREQSQIDIVPEPIAKSCLHPETPPSVTEKQEEEQKPEPEPEPEPESESEPEPEKEEQVSDEVLEEGHSSSPKLYVTELTSHRVQLDEVAVGKSIEKRGTGNRPDEVEPLSPEARIESDLLIELFGENAVATAYSSGWSLKVQGYEKLCTLIRGVKSKEKQEAAVRNLFPLLRIGFNSTLKAVFVEVVDQTIALIDDVRPSSSAVAACIHQVLGIAFKKLESENQRIRERCQKFIEWAAGKDKLSCVEIFQFAVNPAGSVMKYSLMLSKLEIFKTLLGKEHITSSLKLGEVMGIVVPNLESRKLEVRQKAIEIFHVLKGMFGRKADRYLSKLPRLIKEQVLGGVEKGE
jgi:hypothetical protein